MISALLVHGVPIECINRAAITYQVPATLIMSILSVEGGKVGMASPNRNGTYDYGPMQINTIWLDKIRPYGYSQHDVQYDPCANVMVGAWILSTNISESANLWHGIGGYHSNNEPLNVQYQHKVWNVYNVLARYLSSPSKTIANNASAPTPLKATTTSSFSKTPTNSAGWVSYS